MQHLGCDVHSKFRITSYRVHVETIPVDAVYCVHTVLQPLLVQATGCTRVYTLVQQYTVLPTSTSRYRVVLVLSTQYQCTLRY